jgi:hypothetical protein
MVLDNVVDDPKKSWIRSRQTEVDRRTERIRKLRRGSGPPRGKSSCACKASKRDRGLHVRANIYRGEFVGDDSGHWVKFHWDGFAISRHDIQIVLCILSVLLVAALVLIYFLCPQDHMIAVLLAGCFSAAREALCLICRLHTFVVMAPLAMGYMGVIGNAQLPLSLVGIAVPKVILSYTILWFLN